MNKAGNQKTCFLFFLFSLLTVYITFGQPTTGTNDSLQQHRIDSLIRIIPTVNDSSKVIIWNVLSNSLPEKSHETALEYAKNALELAKTLNWDTQIAQAYNNLGILYSKKNNYRKARLHFEQGIQVAGDSSVNQRIHIDLLFNNSLTYIQNGRFFNRHKPVAYLEKSFKIARDMKLEKETKEICFTLYSLFLDYKDYENALKYYQYFASYALGLQYEDQKDEMLDTLSDRYSFEKKQIGIELFNSQLLLNELEEEKQKLKADSRKKTKAIDSLDDIKEKQAKEIQTKEKKLTKQEAIIQLEKERVLRQRYAMILGGVILIIMIVASIVIYRQFIAKKEAYDVLQQQKEKIQTQGEALAIANKQLVTKTNQLVDSINYAKRIQDAILLSEKQIQNFLPQFFVFYKPKDVVSGDFYWFSQIDNKQIIAAIDCTGHGVPGAFMSMIGNTMLHEIVNEKKITQPDEILLKLHKRVSQALKTNTENMESDDGMDMTICTIDKQKNILHFAGAKNYIFIMEKNGNTENNATEIQTYRGDFLSIGGNPLRRNQPIKFTCHNIELEKIIAVYMFSDGYMDQFGGEKNKKFNMSRFKQLILDNIKENMNKQKQIFVETFDAWKGDRKQLDDVLVVGFKIQNSTNQ